MLVNIENWDDFISLSCSHGVFPLVYRTLKSFDNLILNDILNLMKSLNLNIVKRNMLMTSELIKVLKILEKNGIEAIPFKGPVLSQLAYGDVVTRQYSDLDILVKENKLSEVINLLIEYNYKCGIDIKFLSNKTLLEIGSDVSVFTKNKIHIEVHWNLFRKLINSNKYDIWNDENFVLINNNNKIPTIEVNHYFLYLCIHGSKHLWERMEWINDIKLLMSKYEIDWEFLLYESKKLKYKRMFLLGVLITNKLYEIKIPNVLYNELEKEKSVTLVANKLVNFYNNKSSFQEGKLKDILEKFKLISLLHDNTFEIVKYFVFSIVKPTHYDIYFINLHKNLSFLYYFVRPIRFISDLIKK